MTSGSSVIALLLLWGCEGAGSLPPLQELRGEALGTTWMVKWRGGPDEQAARPDIEAALADVDRKMSTWRDDSELQAVRRGPGRVEVSEETWLVVDAALDLAEITGGAFDPTVEPLMELWGFRGQRRTAAPTEDEIAAVRERVGWQKVELGHDEGRAWIDAHGTALDLSAIAKGHAVDRVSQAMSALGATDQLVEVGGEVRAHGSGERGPWRLGVDRPEAGAAPGVDLVAVLEVVNGALATSGNYRNVYEVDGARLVHTMDPRTGRPHESVVASASVLAPDARTADGWATALMVLGPDQGMAAIEARLLIATPQGFEERRSSSLRR